MFNTAKLCVLFVSSDASLLRAFTFSSFRSSQIGDVFHIMFYTCLSILFYFYSFLHFQSSQISSAPYPFALPSRIIQQSFTIPAVPFVFALYIALLAPHISSSRHPFTCGLICQRRQLKFLTVSLHVYVPSPYPGRQQCGAQHPPHDTRTYSERSLQSAVVRTELLRQWTTTTIRLLVYLRIPTVFNTHLVTSNYQEFEQFIAIGNQTVFGLPDEPTLYKAPYEMFSTYSSLRMSPRSTPSLWNLSQSPTTLAWAKSFRALCVGQHVDMTLLRTLVPHNYGRPLRLSYVHYQPDYELLYGEFRIIRPVSGTDTLFQSTPLKHSDELCVTTKNFTSSNSFVEQSLTSSFTTRPILRTFVPTDCPDDQSPTTNTALATYCLYENVHINSLQLARQGP